VQERVEEGTVKLADFSIFLEQLQRRGMLP
jgi:hypothetical protein